MNKATKNKNYIWLKFLLLIYLPLFYLIILLLLDKDEFINPLLIFFTGLIGALFGLIITPALFGLLPFSLIFLFVDSIGVLKNTWQRTIFGSILGTSIFLLIFVIIGYEKFMVKGFNKELQFQILIMLFVYGLTIWSIYILPTLIKKLIDYIRHI